jgi:putative addiction module component (TIGR02574 family)
MQLRRRVAPHPHHRRNAAQPFVAPDVLRLAAPASARKWTQTLRARLAFDQRRSRLELWPLRKTIYTETAMTLPESERAELIGALIDSLDGEAEEDVEEAWLVEIERRASELDSGAVKSMSWDIVKERLIRAQRG